MLQRYAREEIEVVMAHELGHHRHGDIVRLIVVPVGADAFGVLLGENLVL